MIRRFLKLSQAAFGLLIGRSRNGYANYELGKRSLPETTRQRIIRIFRIDPMSPHKAFDFKTADGSSIARRAGAFQRAGKADVRRKTPEHTTPIRPNLNKLVDSRNAYAGDFELFLQASMSKRKQWLVQKMFEVHLFATTLFVLSLCLVEPSNAETVVPQWPTYTEWILLLSATVGTLLLPVQFVVYALHCRQRFKTHGPKVLFRLKT